MGRGTSVYLSYTALVLLSAASGTDAGLWTVDIWEGPAPPPAKGPPFSAHASRNRALLPYQIIGIVGAYVGSVLIIGTLLLTVGRSLRKKAQTMAAQPKEMVKPLPKVMDPSPISPASSKNWYKLRQKKSATSSIRSGASNGMSPAMDSVVSFDPNVVEADRARRQEEMEMLYAAVLAQDERNASQRNLTGAAMTPGTSPPDYSGSYLPRLLTDDPSLRHLQVQGPQSPSTPMSPVRAIYPPGSNVPTGPMSPTSPIRAEYQNYSLPRETSDPKLRGSREGRSGSFNNEQPTTPTAASKENPKKLRKSLRNIKISSPLMRDDNSDGARTPLSPRFYTHPGVPPEPPTSRTTGTMDSYAPTTPGTARTFGDGEDQGEEIDEVRDLPQANPQRLSTHNYYSQAQMLTTTASTRPDPTRPTTNTAGSLPLREMNRQYAAQTQAQQTAQPAFPLSPGQWNNPNNANTPGSAGFGYITSAGPVKTTFVDARRDRLGLGPRTAATPYSPYMPFTPLTPVTPRLTSRAERRQREKEAKKIKGAITEEDAVADEKDLWSSGY